MEIDNYEALPTENMGIHMTAGAIAGIMEHCVVYPIDSVKTRMQSLAPPPEASYRTVRQGLIKMISTEGVARTLRGASAVVVGAGPAHAMYFSAYEGIKAKFKSTSNSSLQNHFINASAGCGATLLHDAIMVPSEVIKQRMQMYNSPYRSCLDCMCKLYCKEGIKAFYRSYSTQVIMNIPFHASHIVMYEKLSDMLNPSREYNSKVHLVAGACAGGIAAAITMPLDMCKTILNTQETSTLAQMKQSRVVGIANALKIIYAMQGFKGFFRGIYARMLYQMPGTAISWSVYELFKHQLLPPRRDVLSSYESSEEELLLREKIHHEKLPQNISYDGGTKPIGLFSHDKVYAESSPFLNK